jgi:cysteinyl-tRNA synthetase
MSRSLGNVILLRHLKEWGFEPLAFRYSLLTAHYRSKMNFTRESLTGAQNALNNLRADLAELPVTSCSASDPWSEEASRVREAFHMAINDDLDLPVALSKAREVPRNTKIEPGERRRLLLDFDRVLGLRLDTVKPRTARQFSDEALALIEKRNQARAAKNWQESDRIRDQLRAMGYEVRDTARGTELV